MQYAIINLAGPDGPDIVDYADDYQSALKKLQRLRYELSDNVLVAVESPPPPLWRQRCARFQTN